MCSRIRSVTGENRVGHAGALDPMATGLLVVALGSATTSLTGGLAGSKEYLATIKLGRLSETWDSDAPWSLEAKVPVFDEDILRMTLREIRDAGKQTPPMVAAVKRKGIKIYKLAHRGWWMERESRPVEIDRLEMVEYRPEAGEIDVVIAGSGGLYVRTVAHDLGVLLGVPALLVQLRRVRVGTYSVEDALYVDEFESTWA